MKIFVLGRSGVGKSPFAAQVANALGCVHLSASAWVRRLFTRDPASFQDRQAFVEAITAFSQARLRDDPDICVRSMREKLQPGRSYVLEGIRNPRDFAHLFDPRTDEVVFLEYEPPDLIPTAFEGGLAVIAGLLDWMVASGMLDPARVVRYRYRALYERDAPDSLEPGEVSSLDAAISSHERRHAPKVRPPDRPRMYEIHAEIPPLRFGVREEYLYDLDPSRKGPIRPCTLFALSNYPGSAPTFQILLDDGSMFSYIPPTGLTTIPGDPGLDLADLVYHDCRKGRIVIHEFEALAGPVLAYFKRRGQWLAGRYLWTVDWYDGNDLLHAIHLDAGPIALLPSHKVKFRGGPPDLPDFRKLHATFTLD